MRIMGRYKKTHVSKPGFPIIGRGIKETTMTDRETGEKTTGRVYDHESFSKADKIAWEKLKK